MMEGWKEVILEDLGFVGRGKSRHRPRNADFLYGNKYPFVQTADVKAANYRILEYSQMYSEDGLKQSKLWPIDTLCVTIAANIADAALLGIEACFPDSVIGFIANSEKSDVRFVKYLFDLLQARIKKISQGAAQDNLSLEKLRTIKFLIPPLPTQRKIATILSAYDDLIENNFKRIKLLEEKAQLTYEEWFVRMKFPGHETTPINEESGLPEGWEVKILGSVTKYIGRGISPKYVEEKGIPIVNQKCIRDFKVNKTLCRLSSTLKKISADKVLKTMDILVNSTGTGTLGRVAQIISISELMTVDTHVTIVRGSENISGIFLGRALEYNQPRIENLGKGATNQIELSRHDLAQLEIIFPSNKLQKEFDKNFRPNYNQIQVLINKNQLLKEARDILLPRLMTGVVDVEGIEVGVVAEMNIN